MIRASEEGEPRGMIIPEIISSDNGVSDHEAHLLDDQGILPRHTPLEEINPTLATTVSPVNHFGQKGEIGEKKVVVPQSSLDGTSEPRVGYGIVDGLTPIGYANDGTGRPIYSSLSSSITQERLESGGALFGPPKPRTPKKIVHRRPRER